ncbi:MAG: HNH endonuclease [Pseudomonadales bacterium]
MWQSDPSQFAQSYGLTLGQCRGLQCTAEHLHARQDGGDNTSSNIVAACLRCNGRRHQKAKAMEPDRYLNYVANRLRKGGWHQQIIRAQIQL